MDDSERKRKKLKALTTFWDGVTLASGIITVVAALIMYVSSFPAREIVGIIVMALGILFVVVSYEISNMFQSQLKREEKRPFYFCEYCHGEHEKGGHRGEDDVK